MQLLKTNLKPMLKYITSTAICMLMVISSLAQNDSIPQDSLKYSLKYGMRVGTDISKLIRTVVDDDFTGFEINADYRIKPNMYIVIM